MHRTLPLSAASLSLLAVSACQSPATTLTTNAPVRTVDAQLDWSAFPLGPNDILRVGVFGHDSLTRPEVRIDMQGNLSLPLIGSVHVAGMSPSQAREAVTQAYAAFVIEPQVDLSVVTYGARRFYALGEFARSGAVEFDRPLTVMQAAALAGGITGRGDSAKVVLLRGGPDDLEVELINLQTLDRKGYLALRPDDILFVRRNNAGKFSDEILPYLTGISSSLASIATVFLIEDSISDRP